MKKRKKNLKTLNIFVSNRKENKTEMQIHKFSCIDSFTGIWFSLIKQKFIVEYILILSNHSLIHSYILHALILKCGLFDFKSACFVATIHYIRHGLLNGRFIEIFSWQSTSCYKQIYTFYLAIYGMCLGWRHKLLLALFHSFIICLASV